ncbi:hypothetical protein HZH68_000068 [Vespula germanica]|uniref:Uncharacterized protein n=1 Tax=Vespula germanica TaxID=30212 RepID=A0A834NSV0_VESGE|nr:hypothetical protein HZH68_000068 [Vespula germanica]
MIMTTAMIVTHNTEHGDGSRISDWSESLECCTLAALRYTMPKIIFYLTYAIWSYQVPPIVISKKDVGVSKSKCLECGLDCPRRNDRIINCKQFTLPSRKEDTLRTQNIIDATNEPLAEQPAAPILGAYPISIKTFLIFMKTPLIFVSQPKFPERAQDSSWYERPAALGSKSHSSLS